MKLQNRATISEVARRAGVSVATVSRALNAPDKLQPETLRRVQQAIAETGYLVNALARGLVSRRSRTVGVLIPTLTNPIFAASTEAAQDVLHERGYNVVVGSYGYDAAVEAELVTGFLERRVDGLILTGVSRDPAIYRQIEDAGTAYVVTWELDPSGAHPCVSFSNRKAAVAMVSYLASLGHRRIGLVLGRTANNDRTAARLVGYRAALNDLGIPFDPAYVVETDMRLEDGRTATDRLLTLPAPPTAIFCANDVLAIGALMEARSRRLPVPDALSIAGFDDLDFARYVSPELTTVRVPSDDMGRRAARLILDLVEAGSHRTVVELPADIIVRESTGPALAGSRSSA